MMKLKLNGYIGPYDDINANDVSKFLDEANGADIEVDLYSPGGDVFEGFQIYSLFNAYTGKKTLNCGALVASAGTYLLLAFDTVNVQDVTNVMIHNVSSYAGGSAEEIAKEAERVASLQNLIASKYAEQMGITTEQANELMKAETWYVGQEIVDAKLADNLIKTGKANANNINFYKNQIKNYFNVARKEKQMTRDEVFAEMRKLNITFDEVVNQFQATNSIKSKEELDKLSKYDNLVKENTRLENELKEIKANEELTNIFGAKDDKNLVRIYADNLFKQGKSVEDMKKDPVMINLVAQKAAGELLGKEEKKPVNKETEWSKL